MKKSFILVIALILVVFLAGCRQISQPGSGVVATSTILREQQPGTYTLKVGDSISISSKVITIMAIDSSNGRVSLNIDGSPVDLEASRVIKVVRNLEIQSLRVDYGRTPSDHTVTLDVKLFELGPDEHYMRASEVITVAGTTVKFEDLTKMDGVRLIVGSGEVIIDLGNSQNAMNLAITHKRAFDNPIKANRYAVLEIKEAP